MKMLNKKKRSMTTLARDRTSLGTAILIVIIALQVKIFRTKAMI